MSDAQHPAGLEDALQELLASAEAPQAEALEEILGRYPEYSAELTDFAVEWALQDLLPAPSGDGDGDGASVEASAIPAALERFRARLDEQGAARVAEAARVSPFADRSPAELSRLATRLGLDKILVAKLRDRKIVAETVPEELRHGLANELGVASSVIAAHLAAPATIPQGANFKAQQAPEAGAKESFAEAVRRSSLTEDKKHHWLAHLRG